MNSNREHLERMVSLRKSIRLVLGFRKTNIVRDDPSIVAHFIEIEVVYNESYTLVTVFVLKIDLSNITGSFNWNLFYYPIS